ncbi:MAG: phytanoyl-CoA dioxygenase family protein [Candidatus Binatia bacterium]
MQNETNPMGIDLASLDPALIDQFRQILLGDVTKLPPFAVDMLRSMGIEPPADAAARQARAVAELGLEKNVRELEEKGYTIVPNAFSTEMADRLREAILRAGEEDRANGIVTMGGGKGPTGHTVFRMVERGRVFEEAAMNPRLLALMTSVLGHGLTISTFTAMIRAQGTPQLPLHSDNQFMPAPFSKWNHGATAVWYLEDLTAEGGASRLVPESCHRLRHPGPGEGEDEAIPLEAPKGSIVMWVANTWHGNCARTIPGERVTLHTAFTRMHMRPMERYDSLPQEVIDRNPPLFAQLVGRTLPFGYDANGPGQLAMLKAHLATHA